MGPVSEKFTEQEFFDFCQLNRDWRIERTGEGEVIAMPPAGGESGNRNFELIGAIRAWSKTDGTGIGFDSSTGFRLPNGAVRSPDASWVRARWDSLSESDRKRFAPICPDFVVEFRSESDPLAAIQEKMEEYVANGAQLGWLIDRIERTVCVYRPGSDVRRLDNPEVLSGEPELKGFPLQMSEIWGD